MERYEVPSAAEELQLFHERAVFSVDGQKSTCLVE